MTKNVLNFLFCLIWIQHINGVNSATNDTYRTPSAEYSSCGPASLMFIISMMFLGLIVVHAVIFGCLLKKLCQKERSKH
jgi:hypothetical protein